MFDKDNILTSPREIALDPNAYEPLRLVLEEARKSRRTKLLVITLVCFGMVLFGGAIIWGWAYPTQKSNPGFWHVTLVSLLYWIGISQALVALSAILRITHASWRYPLNRMLDIGSLFGLWMPLLLPVLIIARREIYGLGMMDHERDRVWDNFGSIAWDSLAVGTAYLAGWMLLYLTSIPDFAMLRDRATPGTKEKKFYGRIAWFWRGSDQQWRVLRRAEGVLVVGILASFMGSQTILGWDFQLAAARNWDSSIFAPLYTLSSLLGALALGVLLMTVTNRLLRGRGFFTLIQYDSLGKFMVGIALIWTYFRICDFLTAWYGHIPEEWLLQQSRTVTFPILVGLMILGCSAIPIFGNLTPVFRKKPWALCTISVFVLVGIACQRYLDTVPTFASNYGPVALLPPLPAILVFFSVAAMFVLTYLLAARYFPIMSWWGTSKERTRTAERKMGNATVTVMVEDPPLWET
ncbi:MAG: hypothetical protein ACRYFS_16865 [Janthinobacterium lividum]